MFSPSQSVRPLREVLDVPRSQLFGPTPWLTVQPEDLRDFVTVTSPGGGGDLTVSLNNELGDTLVDGLFLLSLLPHFFWQLWHYRDDGTWALNYGYDRVRFVTPVHVGERIRLSFRILEASPRGDGGVLVKVANTLEVAGHDRPGLTAESLTLFLDQTEV